MNDNQKMMIDDINNLTSEPVKQLRGVEFGGFLIREDNETIYVADAQGTWIIPREGILSIEDWKSHNAPDNLKNKGKPIRISIKEGTLIHEIRPWEIKRGREILGGGVHREVEKIFTLGGASPIGEHTKIGEDKLVELERLLSRRLGWDPNDDSMKSPRAASSGTIVIVDGMCDEDCDF
jgi:hypothetical protein